MFGDASKDLAQVGLGIQAIELGRADQAIERRSSFAAGVGAREEIILPRATARIARSAALLSISMRPSWQ